MGNAARKERKRAGIKFEHPTKIKTRDRRKVKQGPNMTPEQMSQLVARAAEWPPEYLVSKAQPTNQGKSLGKSKSLTVEPPKDDNRTDQGKQFGIETDPKPFRIGRRRFVDYRDAQADQIDKLDLIHFSPRAKYEQDRKFYSTNIFIGEPE